MQITFITSTPQTASVVQKNALYSWGRLGIPVINVGETVSALTEFDLGFTGDSPLIPDMIKQSIPLVETEMVALINSDILIDDNFLENLRIIIERNGTDIFLTSVRKDTLWEAPIESEEDLKVALNSEFTWHQDASADIFITSRERFEAFSREFPDFIYGRLAWDNAIHVYFRSLGIPCFNTSESLVAYHQRHDYNHLATTDFSTIQRNPSMNPSTNYNCHTFGNFMIKMGLGMASIPRVKTDFRS